MTTDAKIVPDIFPPRCTQCGEVVTGGGPECARCESVTKRYFSAAKIEPVYVAEILGPCNGDGFAVLLMAEVNAAISAGHPHKFTREDVRLLSRFMDMACECGVTSVEDFRDWDLAQKTLPNLVAKIEALLPPE